MAARSRRASIAGGRAPVDTFVEVPQRAAVSLLAPVVQAFADRHGIRVLGIKGQALALQSLRTARATGAVEADHLNGEIALLGRLHGVPTPLNALLQTLANTFARERREAGSMPVAELARLADGAAAFVQEP